MYRVTPYRKGNTVGAKDVFDLFDDFFSDRSMSYIRDFRIDVTDEKDRYVVEAELPGIDKKDVSIKFENDFLTISINQEENNDSKEEKEDKKKYIHRERHLFRSERSILLDDVDPKKVTAKMENGVLKVELMKLEHKVNSYMIDIK
jgi:HSP20 family protein